MLLVIFSTVIYMVIENRSIHIGRINLIYRGNVSIQNIMGVSGSGFSLYIRSCQI